MEAIYACNSARASRREKAGSAVCFVLDNAHANHTIRTFLRDQAPGAVVQPISEAEAWRLIEIEPAAAGDARSNDAAG